MQYGAQYFQRRVAGPRTQSGHTAINARGTSLYCGQRVGDAQGEVVMTVEPYLRVGCQLFP